MPARAFAVWFKDLHLWSVGAYLNLGWQWPPEFIHPLSDALKRKKVEVDRKQYDLDDLQLITLHFDGEIEPRSIKGAKEFKGQLNFADAGDVVYSKIDVRHGAIGIIPNDLRQVAVSSEYPVYEVKQDVALPEYIQLLFRTNHFRHYINSLISGTSGRKRVQPSQLEKLKVPIPTLQAQRSIVAKWHKAQGEIKAAFERIESLKQEIETEFFNKLGLRSPQQVTLSKAFAVLWRDMSRWGVEYNQQMLTIADLSRGKYPVVHLDSILELIQYGTSEKANREGKGIPVLRINNIKGGKLDLTDLKCIDLPHNTVDNLTLKDGDILIIRTSGSRDLVGTCAVFHESITCVFASYLIRLCLNPVKANPDFVGWFLNSSLGRQQINALSRKIMQNNINSEEIKSLKIPLPTLKIQYEIMCSVKEESEKIESARKKAENRAREIETEVEELILGVRQL
jgi:type I restriction enzyme S subunit